jgi:hypothetical protein
MSYIVSIPVWAYSVGDQTADTFYNFKDTCSYWFFYSSDFEKTCLNLFKEPKLSISLISVYYGIGFFRISKIDYF